MNDKLQLAGRALGGRYRIVSVLGSGGFGTVYDAFDERLRRPVAVKVLTPDTTDASVLKRMQELFEQEAIVTARLEHPNVVSVYDWGWDERFRMNFLVMERLQGRDLAAVLAEGPLPAAEALTLLGQASAGLSAGHRAGLIHRDIKPSNLFVCRRHEGSLNLRVLDFGIARVAETDAAEIRNASYVRFRSERYASPEQLRGERLSPASDLFSLGLVAVELFGGRIPPAEARGPDVRRLVLGQASTFPAWLRPVLERALAPAAAQRFQDAGEFQDAMRAARPAATRESPAPAPAQEGPADATLAASMRAHSDRVPATTALRVPPTPPQKRRRLPVAVAAAVGSVAVAGTAWLAFPHASQEPAGPAETRLMPDSAVTAPSPPTVPSAAPRLVSGTAEPQVDRTADGEYRLALPGALWKAVDAFLAPRPGLRLARWADAGPDARTGMEAGSMQYPFALWRDLDDDGDRDVALVFVSTATVNNWDWRDWTLVVFRAWPDGGYDDVAVTTMSGGCFDGMLYVPEMRHVEFGCFEVAVGAFSWNGQGFSVETPMGD